jgi:hypothetical protein
LARRHVNRPAPAAGGGRRGRRSPGGRPAVARHAGVGPAQSRCGQQAPAGRGLLVWRPRFGLLASWARARPPRTTNSEGGAQGKPRRCPRDGAHTRPRPGVLLRAEVSPVVVATFGPTERPREPPARGAFGHRETGHEVVLLVEREFAAGAGDEPPRWWVNLEEAPGAPAWMPKLRYVRCGTRAQARRDIAVRQGDCGPPATSGRWSLDRRQGAQEARRAPSAPRRCPPRPDPRSRVLADLAARGKLNPAASRRSWCCRYASMARHPSRTHRRGSCTG